MVIVRADFPKGYGYWMNGYMPAGNVFSRHLQRFTHDSEQFYQRLSKAERHDKAVRRAYRFILREAYRKLVSPNHDASIALLGDVFGVPNQHRASAQPRAPPLQDHILLASELANGEEFFALVQERYGFAQAEPPNIERGGDIVRSRSAGDQPTRKPEVEELYTFIVSRVMKPYVELFTSPDRAIRDYYHSLSNDTAECC